MRRQKLIYSIYLGIKLSVCVRERLSSINDTQPKFIPNRNILEDAYVRTKLKAVFLETNSGELPYDKRIM